MAEVIKGMTKVGSAVLRSMNPAMGGPSLANDGMPTTDGGMPAHSLFNEKKKVMNMPPCAPHLTPLPINSDNHDIR